ncbi:MAG: hypothetical protein AAFW46_15760 [Pseudomonadota bacterium]
MHILVGLLTLLALLAVWWWRVRAAGAAAREAVEATDDVRAALRRFKYQRKAGEHPAESLDDPRLAAAGMMAAVARLKGDLTADQMNQLRVECRAAFRVVQSEADDIAAYGRWLAAQSEDPDDVIRRLAPIVRDRAEREAHGDMVRMLDRVAAVEGGAPNDLQKAAIARVRKALAVK